MKRPFDIIDSKQEKTFTVFIDGKAVDAVDGETVLATLLAYGIKSIAQNDYGVVSGAYCGMGVCYLCLARINGKEKQRTCQTLVEQGMHIETYRNYNQKNLEYSLHGLECKWTK